LTIGFVPFTRAYPPGHSNLKSLWWLYVLGMVAFAYWPARIALSAIRNPAPLLGLTAVLAVAIGILEVIGRRRALRGRGLWPDAPEDELSDITVSAQCAAKSGRRQSSRLDQRSAGLRRLVSSRSSGPSPDGEWRVLS
jgi:hypothetical protein